MHDTHAAKSTGGGRGGRGLHVHTSCICTVHSGLELLYTRYDVTNVQNATLFNISAKSDTLHGSQDNACNDDTSVMKVTAHLYFQGL